MKYLFTTTNKRSITLLILSFFAFGMQAQKNTDSPYSNYGIGLINLPQFNGNFGMAGTGIAWRPYHFKPQIYDSLARSNAKLNDRGTNYINPTNPASFSNISLTTFEAGAISRNVTATSGSQTKSASNTQLSHVSLAYPLSKNAGMGFGIRPYSFVGYDFFTSGVLNGENITNTFEGSGGVNEVFLGAAVELMDKLSIGFVGEYKFGNLTKNERLTYDNTSNFFFNSLDESRMNVSALTYEVGLQYYTDLTPENRLIVGLTASPVQNLNATESRIIRNYTGDSGNENFRDTGLFVDDQRIDLPNSAEFGLGLAYEKKKHWMINLDMKIADFGDVNVEPGVNLTSSNIASFSYSRFVDLNAFGSYWEKVGYRAGVRYNSSLVEINGEDISEFGIALGINMPLRKSFSTLNFGFEVGRRGMDSNNLIQEDFFKFQFGVTINDKWFIQRKYD